MTDSEPRRRMLVVPNELQRSHPSLRSDGRALQTAVLLLEDLAAALGVSDLSATAICDVGCGVKFSSIIINNDIPVRRYTGLDVDPAVISFLQSAVDDDRFEFHRIDVRNERYNPRGTPLDGDSAFPVLETAPDVITGYSLFTHLDPNDFFEMARMMRVTADESTRLVFTAYLDQHSDGGHGFIDKFSDRFGSSMAGIAKGGYLDVFEDDPLRVTLYDADYARELLVRAGWSLLRVIDPTPQAQHTIVASPLPV